MAEIEWVRRIYSDGWHNAFTDFQQFKGRYYVCFRNGLSHVSPEGKAVVIASDDLAGWTRAGVPVNTPGDDRDPHMVATEDRLFVYAGSVTRPDPGLTGNDVVRVIRTHGVYTQDGETWSNPVKVYRDGFWLWGVGRGKDGFYGLAYGNESTEGDRKPTELHLVQSTDGLDWEFVSVVTKNGSEATFRIAADGAMRVAIRGGDENRFTLATASPPYADWRLQDLGEVIPAPYLVEVGGVEYVIGRRHVRDPGGPGGPGGPGSPEDREQIVERHTGIWRLENGGIVHVLDLPSGGDTSYAGVVQQEDGSLLISYYSQHEVEKGEKHYLYPANIYLARVRL